MPLTSHCRTTYVGQVMAYEHNAEPDATLATRKGEFAMLLYSLGTWNGPEFNVTT